MPWPIWITRRRSTLSAIAPPKSANTSTATLPPALTIPTSVADPVNSYVRYPRTSICICVAPMRKTVPSHSRKKCLFSNERRMEGRLAVVGRRDAGEAPL